MRFSAPVSSRMVLESIEVAVLKAMRPGMFALMVPVMIFASGRWVARMRWMPAARALAVRRAMSGVTSLPLEAMRSATSSMMMTM